MAFVLSEDGRLSRYLYGIEYPARDMKLALVEAGKGKVGTAFDRVILTCFKYDPAKRSYGPTCWRSSASGPCSSSPRWWSY